MKKNPRSQATAGAVRHRSGTQRLFALALAVVLLLTARRVRGEDHIDYRYHNYREEDGRIRVETHSMLFEVAPTPSLTLSGQAVYDAISGASPTGAPPRKGSNQVPLAPLEDEREAGNLSASIPWLKKPLCPPSIATSVSRAACWPSSLATAASSSSTATCAATSIPT